MAEKRYVLLSQVVYSMKRLIDRDLNLILDAYEKGEKFYLYTGR